MWTYFTPVPAPITGRKLFALSVLGDIQTLSSGTAQLNLVKATGSQRTTGNTTTDSWYVSTSGSYAYFNGDAEYYTMYLSSGVSSGTRYSIVAWWLQPAS